MARTANEVSINVVAYDQASDIFNKVEKNVKRLPEATAKAATALSVLDGALGSSGSQAMQTVGKLTGLASIMATGGILGVGIAATSLAVEAGSAVWKTYQIESENTANALVSLNRILEQMQGRLDDQSKATKKAQDAVLNFGLSSDQIRINELKATNEKTSKSIPAMALEIEKMKEKNKELKETMRLWIDASRLGEQSTLISEQEINTIKRKIDENNNEIISRNKALDIAKNGQALRSEEATAIEKLITLQEKNNRSREAASRIEKEHNEALKNAIAGIKEYGKATERNIQYTESLEKRKQQGMNEIYAKNEQRRIDASNLIEETNHNNQQKSLEMQERTANEIMNIQRNAAHTIADGFGMAFAAIATGSQSAGLIMAQTFINAAEAAIRAAAASAAAQAAFSQAGIPIIGPALAAAAAAAMFGLVRGFLAKVTMAEGGLITKGMIHGGIPYTDSVNVVAQQGEGFLSREDVKLIKGFISSARGRDGGSSVYNVNLKSVVPPVSGDMSKITRELIKHIDRLRARGYGYA